MSRLALFQNGKSIEKITFPSTRRGKSNTVQVEVMNISTNYIHFAEAKFDDKDCSIINLPVGLEPGDKLEFLARFSPSTDRETPLNTSIYFDMDVG